MPSYRRFQQFAVAISAVSVLYNGAEGVLSIVFGAESSSKSLIFFGIQSAIEVISAVLVLRRFRNIAKPGEERGANLKPEELRYGSLKHSFT
jgi:predicted Co/Zn/Cd cation transporter (cation efflux family)